MPGKHQSLNVLNTIREIIFLSYLISENSRGPVVAAKDIFQSFANNLQTIVVTGSKDKPQQQSEKL